LVAVFIVFFVVSPFLGCVTAGRLRSLVLASGQVDRRFALACVRRAERNSDARESETSVFRQSVAPVPVPDWSTGEPALLWRSGCR
jgi:hypothetical protein